MRSVRLLMATGAASALLAFGAPVAYASGGWEGSDSSAGGEHAQGQDKPAAGDAQRDEGSWSGKQDGGSWSGTQEDGSRAGGQDEESWGGGHEKPRGGMHTGGGGLAAPAVTAGGLAVLAVAGTVLYAARRKKTADVQEPAATGTDGLPAVSVPLHPIQEISEIEIQRAGFGVL